jgi:hypothetical protein
MRSDALANAIELSALTDAQAFALSTDLDRGLQTQREG